MRLIGIEAGGTKFFCVLGNENGIIEDRQKISTEAPHRTMPAVLNFIEKHHADRPIDAIGLGSFGPIDLNSNSQTYGYITATPKHEWKNFNIVGAIQAKFKLPLNFDTDVNAAALGEFYWGEGQGYKNIIYLTVGTGIGGGVILNEKLHHGLLHPEMGHILIPQHLHHDPFKGICPNHSNCLEGLASGPALKSRWQVDSAMDLPPQHPAWALEAEYLANALVNYILCFSPEKIILGGGVMQQKQLLPLIQEKTFQLLGGYIQNLGKEQLKDMIVSTKLANMAGSIGALALAKCALSP